MTREIVMPSNSERPDQNVLYQEAGTFWRHCSTLRRTSIGFVFAASTASLGVIQDKFDELNLVTSLVAIVNIILCVGAFLQELQIYGYQRLLGIYLNENEYGIGPYSRSHSAKMRLGTSFIMKSACVFLTICWLFVLMQQVTQSTKSSNCTPLHSEELSNSSQQSVQIDSDTDLPSATDEDGRMCRP